METWKEEVKRRGIEEEELEEEESLDEDLSYFKREGFFNEDFTGATQGER